MKYELNKKLIVYIARSGKRECVYCGIIAFSHRHQIGTLPKDFERLPTAPKPMKRIKKECSHEWSYWSCKKCHKSMREIYGTWENHEKCNEKCKANPYSCSCKCHFSPSPKPTKMEIEEIKTNPINEHTDINIVIIVNKLNEVIRAVNKLLSH